MYLVISLPRAPLPPPPSPLKWCCIEICVQIFFFFMFLEVEWPRKKLDTYLNFKFW